MVYEGRRYRSSRRRRRSTAGGQNGKTAARLTICLWVLFLAVMLRVLFPTAVAGVKDAVLDALGGHVNYTAAVQIMGDAVHDGKNILVALYEACTYAFKASDDGIEASANAGESDGLSDAERTNNVPVTDGLVESDVFGTDMQPSSETPEDAVTTDPVERFRMRQADFAALEPPNHVTYAMPELLLTGALPVEGTVTSGFGYRGHPSDGEVRFHYGVDIGVEEGTDIRAFADGTVLAVGESTSYGTYVIVEHEGRVESLYAHLSMASVHGGQSVTMGEKIGEAGDTGNATSSCLHFELLIDGDYVNPEYYLDWNSGYAD